LFTPEGKDIEIQQHWEQMAGAKFSQLL